MKTLFNLFLGLGISVLGATSVWAADPVPKGFKFKDSVVGKGKVAEAGKKIKVHYTGTLLNGKKFDSSLDRNEPFEFTLGAGEVIRGWDLGIGGTKAEGKSKAIPAMKVGGKRTLTIPPEAAYGDRAMGDVIPANSTLKFDVELLDVQ